MSAESKGSGSIEFKCNCYAHWIIHKNFNWLLTGCSIHRSRFSPEIRCYLQVKWWRTIRNILFIWICHPLKFFSLTLCFFRLPNSLFLPTRNFHCNSRFIWLLKCSLHNWASSHVEDSFVYSTTIEFGWGLLPDFSIVHKFIFNIFTGQAFYENIFRK